MIYTRYNSLTYIPCFQRTYAFYGTNAKGWKGRSAHGKHQVANEVEMAQAGEIYATPPGGCQGGA